MSKIEMKTPLVEMDGDEMTRIIWQIIKDELICPYVDLKTEYYDLGLKHRDETGDQVTIDSAGGHQAPGRGCQVRNHHPQRPARGGVPPAPDVEEPQRRHPLYARRHHLPRTHRGQGHRACGQVLELAPITIARHGYGDVYKNVEYRVPGAGKAELVFTDADGHEERRLIHDFDQPGVIQGMHNVDSSIEGFARSCFEYALSTHQDLWFALEGHHLEDLRPPLQGHLCRHVRGRVQGALRGSSASRTSTPSSTTPLLAS